MARRDRRLATNVPGPFFVDDTCIDCDTCRAFAPATFGRKEELSFVQRQPATPEEVHRANMAIVACPTHSIGTEGKQDLAAARRAFPDPIAEGVSFCGFNAESSFGAWSYLIERPAGNVLVDSPVFARPLVERIRERGGIALIFLTHQDDVADHEKWAKEFGAKRILHRGDISHGTRTVEIPVEGTQEVRLADDLVVIPTPGHTRGHSVLLYREQFLFTGDHLSWDDEDRIIAGWPEVCWYDWAEQQRSARKLLDRRFTWLLPGHGRRIHGTPEEMHGHLERGLQWMAAR